MRVYHYKLTTDDGGAPCVQHGLLSLAICKPMIRSTAQPGDLIFGFAANSLHPDNRLIYVACVTEKARNGEYYTSARYSQRADCIYELRDDRFVWRQGASYHGPHHLERDLGPHPDYPRANVLLSGDFRYFGKDGTADYKSRYPLLKKAVECLGQGYRVHQSEQLMKELMALKQQLWIEYPRGFAGVPTSRPRRGACHRGRSCGVLEAKRERRNDRTEL